METDRAQRILEVIRREIGEVSPASSIEDMEIDSLEFLSLCQALEAEFAVKLEDEALTQVETIADLIGLVECQAA